MKRQKTLAQRLGRVLETMTRQSGRLPETPAYGSWLLGRFAENPRRRRVRIQVLLTAVVIVTNLIGIAAALTLIAVAYPTPSVFTEAPAWLTFGVVPGYIVVALVVGIYWLTERTIKDLRWAITGHAPDRRNERDTLLAPWRLAAVLLGLWGFGTLLLTVLYGIVNPLFIPTVLFTVGFSGVMVATACYLATEFALRPVAARALMAGRPPDRLAPGIMGRTMTVWLLGSGLPVLGIVLTVVFSLTLHNLTLTQMRIAVLLLALVTLVFGFLLMWVLSWLIATPIRVVRAALKRVEGGDLRGDLVVFDATELGELQAGFNAMVRGLRERERVRDLFGRHVGREVAAAAERERPKLGGEERTVAVVFVDIIGSTQMVTSRSATEMVTLLNRFFAVVVDEVDRHRGLVNKFEGDATLAIFGAPNHLDHPVDEALSAARAIQRRLSIEVPECRAGIGIAAGRVVAGNLGAKERFEYTVIGEPVNEAARLSELAKSRAVPVLTSAPTIAAATEHERTHWVTAETVTLRGYQEPTALATLVTADG